MHICRFDMNLYRLFDANTKYLRLDEFSNYRSVRYTLNLREVDSGKFDRFRRDRSNFVIALNVLAGVRKVNAALNLIKCSLF